MRARGPLFVLMLAGCTTAVVPEGDEGFASEPMTKGAETMASTPAMVESASPAPANDCDPFPKELRDELRDAVGWVASTWLATQGPPEEMAWNWGEGVLAYGLVAASRSTGSARFSDYVRAYTRHHIAAGTSVEWSDHTTPALAALELASESPNDGTLLPIVDRVVRYIMTAPRTSTNGLIRHLGTREDDWVIRLGKAFLPRAFPDVWVDTLFHVVPTLRRYTELTGDPSYMDEALFQTLGFFRHLQDPASGLLAHGYFDAPRDEVVPPFANDELWARGNGWAIFTGVDLLTRLPPSAGRDELAGRVLRLEDTLRKHQDPETGLFHTLLRKPSTYIETAGSGLIVHAMARGLRAGLFGAGARETATLGGRGLLRRLRSVRSSTLVTGTSIGTNPVAGLYRFVPVRDQVTYGVGAFLLAASEIAGPASEAARPSCLP